MKKTTIILLILVSLAANSAIAKDRDKDDDDHHWCHSSDGRGCVSAPEIDPAQALGALSLLAGTVAIVRGYRRKK